MNAIFDQSSFRDRRARVFRVGDAVYRGLDETAWDNWRRLKETKFFRALLADGSIPATAEVASERLIELPKDVPWAGVLEHETIPAVTYPYEWSFSRLQDAALFHLDLMTSALAENWILKDSTPFNIQWRGSRPIFIDLPSFEPLVPGEPWVGYRQFCEMFLNPLLLAAYKGVRFQPWLRGRIDGIDVEQMAGLLSLRDLLFRRGVIGHVYLHAKLQRAMEGSRSVSKTSLRSAGYGKDIILANVRGMRRLVSRLRPGGRIGHWADYATTHSYDAADYRLKQSFVAEVAGERRWKTVWDLGCNTGDFSRLAAEHSDLVIAMDADETAVERIYVRAREEKSQNLLALVTDLSDPSPALGWRGRERLSLEERRPPDLVLALALIHHTTFSANIPLADFVDWLAGMNTAVVIEFVSKQDEMSQVLLRNKPDIYSDYSEEKMRSYLDRRFTIKRTQPLKGGLRTLYYVVPKTG